MRWTVRGDRMNKIERLLEPGSTDLPTCRCGYEMYFASMEAVERHADCSIKVYRCGACQHELRLTVWCAEAV